MSQEQFDRLLEAMPKMAEAVNGFNSEELQRDALNALVQAFGIPSKPVQSGQVPQNGDPGEVAGNPAPSAHSTSNTDNGPALGASTPPKRNRKASSKRSVNPVKDLDLRPQGKKSFKDLVAEKQPSGTNEQNLVAVYYLEEVLSLPEIGTGHVLVAYRECGWREPNNLAQSLRDTASKKSWLDTSNGSKLAITPQGRNIVNHDMPLKRSEAK